MNFEIDSDVRLGRAFEGCFCPSCHNLIVRSYTGQFHSGANGDRWISDPGDNEVIVFPLNKNKLTISEDIPETYFNDFVEATNVISISPKSSAALSRRCLQKFLHHELNIKKRNLEQEIEEFITSQQVPSYISAAVDAVRIIGNYAAHPMKNTNTGEIVDVEPAEAEWLLEVLALLFEFYFVYPKKLEERKIELNKKLQSLGKPPMK
ncbi:DUF4145 domain-containing protein [Acinetobacter sp. CUI P1]|nr:DUF4145 domain-containing protein [Acinetobacter sp. CUI P1]